MIALFMTAMPVSNVIGGPISGGIMQWMDGLNGWHGWQWLFLLEGFPSILLGLLVPVLLDDGPAKVKWLTDAEKSTVIQHLAADEAAKQSNGVKHKFIDVFRDSRIWALAFVFLCTGSGFYAINFWMPTIIQELGLDPGNYFEVGLLSMIPWGIAAVSMVLVASHSDKTGALVARDRPCHGRSSRFIWAVAGWPQWSGLNGLPHHDLRRAA